MKHTILLLAVLFSFQMATAATFGERGGAKVDFRLELWESTVKERDNVAIMDASINPITLVIKEGIKKVIRAFDLMVQGWQEVQLKIQLALEQAKNVMSEARLSEVNELVREKKEIFDRYYQELWTVKNKIDQVRAIKEALVGQAQLIEGFTSVYGKFSSDSYLNDDELTIIYNVYQGMLEKNVDQISDLVMLIKDFKVKMQDGDRLRLIQDKLAAIQEVTGDFNEFTKGVVNLSLSRVKENDQINEMKLYYGMEN